MKYLIGSTAIKHWYHNFPREPKDIDYFSPEKIEGAETFWHSELENLIASPFGYAAYFQKVDSEWIATPRTLYTIKVSHAFWNLRNGSWEKHMGDILWFQRNTRRGVTTINPILYDTLYHIWEERYGKKKVNLEKTPEEFFASTVSRTYEHDSIHASVAYYDEPLFNAVLRDGHAVAVDWSKFSALSRQDRLRLVREEVYATALERLVIPSNYEYNELRAYRWALKQTITSFWKGKWSLWIVENFNDLILPEVDYIQRHKDNSHKLILLEG